MAGNDLIVGTDDSYHGLLDLFVGKTQSVQQGTCRCLLQTTFHVITLHTVLPSSPGNVLPGHITSSRTFLIVYFLSFILGKPIVGQSDSLGDQGSHLICLHLRLTRLCDIDGSVSLCKNLLYRFLNGICLLVQIEAVPKHHGC